MATIISENRVVMGQPVYRFEIEFKDQDTKTEYFDQGWKQAVRAFQLSKTGFSIVCREWSKKNNEWENTTDATIEEGRVRAERSRAANGNKEVEPKEIVPTMTEGQLNTIKFASETLRMIGIIGKKQLPDEETKINVGAELMNVLGAIGYSVKDIKHLVNQYDASLKVQVTE